MDLRSFNLCKHIDNQPIHLVHLCLPRKLDLCVQSTKQDLGIILFQADVQAFEDLSKHNV